MQRLVLVGAGPAHVTVLEAIARRRIPPAEVTLIAAAEREPYCEMVPGLIAGRYQRVETELDLRGLTRAAGATLQIGSRAETDRTARRLTLTDGRSVEYDFLSEAPQRPVEEAAVVRAAERPGGIAIVIAGGDRPAIELACAVRARLGPPASERGDSVAVVERHPSLLEGWAPAASALAERVLASQRIGVATGSAVADETEGSIRLESGAMMRCDLLLRGSAADAGQSPPDGPALVRWLAAALAGREALRAAPRRRGLSLIDTSDGRAIAAYGTAAFHSRAACMLRTAMDRAFVRRVTRLTTAPTPRGYHDS